MVIHHAAARAQGIDRANQRAQGTLRGSAQGTLRGSAQPTELQKKLLRSQTRAVKEVEIAEETPTVVEDWRFHGVIYCAIVLNAVQMGLQVDIRGEPYDSLWAVASHVFTTIFALEMLVKVWCLRLEYFGSWWNILDFAIAWLGVFDTWILPNFVDPDDVGLLLPFQSLRLVRMIKLLRIRRELVALISGLLGSLKCMLWIGVLLLLTVYTFGIFCAQVINSVDYSQTSLKTDQYFGSLPRAMLTLFNICILDVWSTVIYPIWEVQWFLTPLFVCFLVFTSFGLLNALIGVIVEQTTLATKQMELENACEERDAKMQRVESLVAMVLEIDTDRSGCISEEEMRAAQANPELKQMMREMDLPPGFSLMQLHTMLDEDNSGELDREEFIGGMYRLVYCNDFHAHCLHQLSSARLRKAIDSARDEIKREVQALGRELRAELKQGPARKLMEVTTSGSIFEDEKLRPKQHKAKAARARKVRLKQRDSAPPQPEAPPPFYSSESSGEDATAPSGKGPRRLKKRWNSVAVEQSAAGSSFSAAAPPFSGDLSEGLL